MFLRPIKLILVLYRGNEDDIKANYYTIGIQLNYYIIDIETNYYIFDIESNYYKTKNYFFF